MIYESTTITKAEGTVSDLVLYDRLGTPCIRSRPAHYRDAKSPAQILARAKFEALTNIGRQYQVTGNPCYQSMPTGRTRLNQFISLNKNNYDPNTGVYAWGSMVLSTGSVTYISLLSLTRNANNDLRTTWTSSNMQGMGANSLVELFLFDTAAVKLVATLKRTFGQVSGVFVGTNTYSVRNWQCFGVFQTAAGGSISNTARFNRTI